MVLLLSGSSALYAADENEAVNGTKHFRLRYVINIEKLDSSFLDNSDRIVDIYDFLSEVRDDSLLTITGVDYRGTASPDGAYDFNVWLSENRLRTFKELINSYVTIPDSIINAQTSDIPWDEFRAKVVEADNVPMKETVLAIIDEGPSLVPYFNNRRIDPRLLKLKTLDHGRVWDVLRSPILRDLRYGDAIFHYQYLLPLMSYSLPLAATVPPVSIVAVPVFPTVETWTPNIYLKTNLIGWAAGSVNVGVEFDLAPHWSFTLPWYYCAWDYFKSTIKFRNFTLQPEFRYWPNAKGYNHGFFVGAHFGAMAYNFAIDGKYRYQDRRGTHPALGGGIGIGYRKPISKNKRWHVEFTAGAGYYHLDYNVYENTPNYKEGKLVRSKKKNWFGLDQAAITISYSFPLTRYTRVYKK